MNHDLVLTLANGCSIATDGDANYSYGDCVVVYDAEGNEIGQWAHEEWRDDPILVMGAILSCAHSGKRK